MAVVTPRPRIGKYAASVYNPRPADSERQPRNAAFHNRSEEAAPVAKLTTRARKALPSADFAGGGRSFPIPDKSHARNALARVANKSPAVKAKVRSAVKRKFPGIGKKSKSRGIINRG